MENSFFGKAGLDMQFKLRKLSYPIVLSISLTNRCNMSCLFCAVSSCSSIDFVHKDIDKELCMKIMTDAKRNCAQKIVFTGGEPLLYNEENFFEILQHGKKLKLDMSLITNASILNPKLIKRLSMYIKNINISIHGSEPMHNAITGTQFYSKIIDSINYINNTTDIKVAVFYTLTKLNSSVTEIDSVMNITKKFNMPLYISRGNDVGVCKENSIYPSIDDLNKIARRMIEYRKEGYFIQFSNSVPKCILDDELTSLSKECSSGAGYCSIDSNGKVKVCSQSEKYVGEIDYNGYLRKAWCSEECDVYRNLSKLNPVCKSCESLITCKGGCKVEEYNGYVIDKMLVQKIEQIWLKYRDKQVKLKTKAFKEEKNSILIYTCPALICSKNYLDILLLLIKREGIVINKLLNVNKEFICDFEIKMIIYYLIEKKMLYFLER